jgi:hypothetical protein
MNQKLIELLVCPQCKGKLLWQESTQELWCFPDRFAFPVREDIPVMLISEARTLADEEIS